MARSSNQAERDLRPAKTQQKISGLLRHKKPPATGTPSAATHPPPRKHGHDIFTAIRDALAGIPWMPPVTATA